MSDVLRHYLRRPLLVLGGIEALVLLFCAYVGSWIALGTFPDVAFLPSALVFTAVMLLAMMSTDVYGARLREGLPGMIMRTLVAFFVVGTLSVAIVFYVIPWLDMGRGLLLFATSLAFVTIVLLRWLAFGMLHDDALKRHVLVLGTGERAMRIATRMRRGYDRRGFELHGYVPVENTPNLVSAQGARVWQPSTPLVDYCNEHHIDEIVVAVDERAQSHVSVKQLLACRLAGISVIDVLTFVEREAGRVDLDLITPEWLVFSRGFGRRPLHRLGKRGFDVLVASLLLVLSAPLFLMGIMSSLAASRFRGPIFSRESCTGFDGRSFERLGFNGAKVSDDVARADVICRLPELLNVLAGTMSLVGPRPKATQDLAGDSSAPPFVKERTDLRPGIVGWAELNCGSDEDELGARENLQYDLYYLKNHTLLLDLAILVHSAQMLSFKDS